MPAKVKPTVVKNKMMEYRRKQKVYYDRGAKEVKSIMPADAVRVWSPEGWKPAELIARHHYPMSYIIKAGQQGRLFRRNRRDLMVTQEAPHTIEQNDTNPEERESQRTPNRPNSENRLEQH
jgi:hypothetical protein